MRDLDSLALRVRDNQLFILDQQLLPFEERWLRLESPQDTVAAIQALKIRGAPLIGVCAAISLALYSLQKVSGEKILQAARVLRAARPTAVNLMAAIDRMLKNDGAHEISPQHLQQTAEALFDEDVLLCEQMARHGVKLIAEGDRIVTHCNSGGLAAAGAGTALGVIIRAHEADLGIHVYVDETRPLFQGARLTAWELARHGIPHTLICDNMAASLMAAGKISKAFVGADRIAANGDFANKIGTYGLAVSAHHHCVPFYPVAPRTTLDLGCKSGKDIPIEQRNAQEVRGFSAAGGECVWAAVRSPVFNPAFDVTPAALISGLVTDAGYFSREQIETGCLRGLHA